jgi:hypothetical protein
MRQINLKNYVGFRIETKITQDRVLDGVKVLPWKQPDLEKKISSWLESEVKFKAFIVT